MFMVVVDAHSKWIEAFSMNTTSTDNGSNFVRDEFGNFLKQNGIRHVRTAPHHPSSNQLVERAVQNVEGRKKLKEGSLENRVLFLSRYQITLELARLDLMHREIGRKSRGLIYTLKSVQDGRRPSLSRVSFSF